MNFNVLKALNYGNKLKIEAQKRRLSAYPAKNVRWFCSKSNSQKTNCN
jgi:hypothetical protein